MGHVVGWVVRVGVGVVSCGGGSWWEVRGEGRWLWGVWLVHGGGVGGYDLGGVWRLLISFGVLFQCRTGVDSCDAQIIVVGTCVECSSNVLCSEVDELRTD